jgi:hypothetical protein
MAIIAFDVDETLEISGGPVKLHDLALLRTRGHTLGLCGNWGLVTHFVAEWDKLFSFIGPIGIDKPTFLKQLKTYVHGTRFVLVGNDHRLGSYKSPDDFILSRDTGWEFVSELHFKVEKFS